MANEEKGRQIGTAIDIASLGTTAGFGTLVGTLADKSGLFKTKSDRTQEMIDMRRAQIQQFGLQLAQAREKLRQRTMALQQETFKRFVPELEAQFASRGKTVAGGAFQSELAKATALNQKELELQDAMQERTDLGAVQELETGAANMSIQTERDRFANELARVRDQQVGLGKFAGKALLGSTGLDDGGLSSLLLGNKKKSRGVVKGTEE